MGGNYKAPDLRKTTAQGHEAVQPSRMLRPLGAIFNTRMLKGSAPWRDDKARSYYRGHPGLTQQPMMEAFMNARSIRSAHALVWRLILVSILLLPWPAMAEEDATLPLSKIVLYSSGVGDFQHDGTGNNRTQLDLRLQTNQINDMLKSLVVQDFGGGRVSTVTSGSRDPVTTTLGNI